MADNEPQAQMVKLGDDLTPGAYLKKAREEQEKSLVDISEELHLDRWMLEAIERDDFASLGAPVFAKGHLRQYAKSLGIDPDELMVGYYQVCGSREQPPLLADSMLRAENHSEQNFSWVLPLLLALIVIGAISALIFWYMQPPEEPAVIGADNPKLSLELNRQMSIPEQTNNDGEDAISSDIVTDETPAEPQQDTVDRLLVPVDQAPNIIDVSDGSDEPIVSKNITVTLRFNSESWVEVYDAKRQKLLYGLVESASAKYLSGPPPISVFLGHQNAVDVEVNGAPYVIPPSALRGNTARFQIEKAD